MEGSSPPGVAMMMENGSKNQPQAIARDPMGFLNGNAKTKKNMNKLNISKLENTRFLGITQSNVALIDNFVSNDIYTATKCIVIKKRHTNGN